jgi:mercuric ion transport protein
MKPGTEEFWLKFGIVGAVIVALCCFTPVLVLLLGALGLGVVTGTLDYILLPVLAAFVALTLYAWVKRKQRQRGG